MLQSCLGAQLRFKSRVKHGTLRGLWRRVKRCSSAAEVVSASVWLRKSTAEEGALRKKIQAKIFGV